MIPVIIRQGLEAAMRGILYRVGYNAMTPPAPGTLKELNRMHSYILNHDRLKGVDLTKINVEVLPIETVEALINHHIGQRLRDIRDQPFRVELHRPSPVVRYIEARLVNGTDYLVSNQYEPCDIWAAVIWAAEHIRDSLTNVEYS